MKKVELEAYHKEILHDIYDIVLSPETSEQERAILLRYKQAIEKGEYFPRVMGQLEAELRPLAIRRELSKAVSKLYMKASSRKGEPKGGGPMFLGGIL